MENDNLGIPLYRLSGTGMGSTSNPNGIGQDVGVEYRTDLGDLDGRRNKKSNCDCNHKGAQSGQVRRRIGNAREAMGTLFGEMCGLDGVFGPDLGAACGDFNKLKDYHDQFMLRLRAHIRNSYNWLFTMAAKGYVQHPVAQKYMAAYKAIDDNWNDEQAREAALTQLENLQNDREIAIEVAKAICAHMGIQKAEVIATTNSRVVNPGPGGGAIPAHFEKRQDVTVMKGLGNVFEATTTRMDGFAGQIQGTVIASIDGNLGNTDDSIVAFDDAEHVGWLGLVEDDEEEIYVLTGYSSSLGKVKIKIKPKNVGKAIKKATQAVKKTVNKVAAGAKADIKVAAQSGKDAVKKVAQKTAQVAKKATKAVKTAAAKTWQATKKVNPALVLSRNGFLLAARLNLGKMAQRLKWGYATPDQAKRARMSTAHYNDAKARLAKAEKLFVQKLGGSANALRKAVLASKKGRLNGLAGDPVTITAAIVAALPVILEVLKILKGSPVQQADGTFTEDPNVDFDTQNPTKGAEGDMTEINLKEYDLEEQNRTTNTPPVQTSNSNDNSSYVSDSEIEQSSNSRYEPTNYTNTPVNSNTSNQEETPDTNTTNVDFENISEAKTPAADGGDGKSGSSNGLLLGGLALGAIGLVAVSGSRGSSAKKGDLNGLKPVTID
jgi:hypothetical protein